MQAIHPQILTELTKIAQKACRENRWTGDYPENVHGSHIQANILNVDEHKVEFKVSLFRRNSPGFGNYWAEHHTAMVIGQTHWLYYSDLGGVDSIGTVQNGECQQGVTRNEIDDWVLSSQKLALQRPTNG